MPTHHKALWTLCHPLGHTSSLWPRHPVAVVSQMAERDTAVTLTLRRAPDGGVVSSAGHGAPLELVVLSRWPGAMVDWNGEEVIL